MCLAVATHDPRICAAAFASQRGTCEALATGDAKRCANGTPDEQRRCDRELQRGASLLVPEEHEAHDTSKPKGTFTLKGTAVNGDADAGDVDLAAELEPGIVVAPEPTGGTRYDVAHDREAGLRLPGRAAPDRARFSASVVVDAGVTKVTRFEVMVPNKPTILCPSMHCTVTADVPKGDVKRGMPMAIAFDGAYDTPAGKVSLHAQVDSFVRDVVTRATLYAPR
jgi:hypothetical protein